MNGAKNMDRKLKILIENESNLGPVFEIDPARFAQACERHPAIAARIEAVFSEDANNFAAHIGDTDVLVGWSFPHQSLREQAPRLSWVHLTGAGINHLAPFDWVPKGVQVTNNRGVHAPKVAEFGALAALMIVQRMPFIVSQQRRHHWELNYSPSIVGLTAGIVGVGNMGAAIAASCRKLGMRVIGLRRSGREHPEVQTMYGPSGLNEVLAQADVLFVCAPLTHETRGLIGPEQLAKMKRGAGIVNVARGALIDADALRAALASGQLSGAILDVFDPEPLPVDSALWSTPNLVITPHCSSDDAAQYVPRTLDLIFANLDRLMRSEPLAAKVDLELGY